MPKAVTVVDSGGLPVVDATPESGTPSTNPTNLGTPVTPVDSGGLPVTIVESLGKPVVFVTEDLAEYRRGGASVLPDFAYEAETEILAASFSTPPTRRRKGTMNWAIKTLDEAGVWPKIVRFYKVGADEDASLTDWKTGTKATKVGSPTHTANTTWAAASGGYIRTGIYLDDLSPSSCGIFLHGTGTGTGNQGALDGSGNGLTICPVGGTSTMQARCGGAAVTTIATSSDWAASGVVIACRSNGSTFDAYRGPVKKASVSNSSAGSLGHIEICFMGNNNNGSVSTGGTIPNSTCFGILNAALTEAEAAVLANVIYELNHEFRYGEFDRYEAGYQPAEVTAVDLVVFGENAQGLCAAYEAKRRGLDVVVVSGWRPQPGMSRGGLGYTDFDEPSQLGGLPRWLLTQVQAIQGTASTNFVFAPKNFDRVIRGLFDPRITNGLDIPIHYTTGIASVQKSGARIVSFTTVDGKTFSAPYFIDASYEGDLTYKAGVSVRYGRESSAEFSEALAGFRGVITSDDGDFHQFKDHAGSLVNIDPYVTPGDSGSGLLPSLQGTYGVGTPSNGAADTKSQAFNFRLTTTTDAAYKIPFATSPSADFDPLLFEPLLRLFDADSTIALGDIVKADAVGGAIYDINARAGQSSDFWGASTGFLTGSYAEREAIRQRILNYHNDFWYFLKYHSDARILSAVRTSALNHGLSHEHYCRPEKSGDLYNFSPQLYIREGFRLDNDFMLRHSDFFMTDGTAPRSDKTITMASYALDSHSVQALADPNGGNPRIWNEGNFIAVLTGNKYVPIPYEAITPRESECENLLVTFAMAATHVAFGSIRMEFTSMQASQSAAIMIDLAIDGGNIAVQGVDYGDFQTAAAASNTLSGESAPVLTQTN